MEIENAKMVTMDTIPDFALVNATTAIDFASNDSITESYDNDTSINYCPYVKSPISNIILVLLYSLVCIVGIVGNSLVIFVVLKFK